MTFSGLYQCREYYVKNISQTNPLLLNDTVNTIGKSSHKPPKNAFSCCTAIGDLGSFTHTQKL